MNTEMANDSQMTLGELMPEIYQKPTAGASDSLVRTSGQWTYVITKQKFEEITGIKV